MIQTALLAESGITPPRHPSEPFPEAHFAATLDALAAAAMADDLGAVRAALGAVHGLLMSWVRASEGYVWWRARASDCVWWLHWLCFCFAFIAFPSETHT